MLLDYELFSKLLKVMPGGYLKDVNGNKLTDLLDSSIYYLNDRENFNLMGDWSSITKLGRSNQRLLHLNSYVADFFPGIKNFDFSRINRAIELAEHWATIFSYDVHKNSMAYHDEATARRISYWIKLYIVTILDNRSSEALKVLALLDGQIRVLIDDEFYAGRNNHGMFQDFVIIQCSILGLIKSPITVKSIDRLYEYFDWCVTSDGVHKEHSPSYHFIVANQLKSHLTLIEFLSPSHTQLFLKILDRMKGFAVDILLPSHEYPPIGDTSQISISKNYFEVFGLNGDELIAKKFAFYPVGGYSVFRDDSYKSYGLFIAAHHGLYHKHQDELSFIYYKNGWVLCESGPYGYDYQHPHSLFAYSNHAHNSLVANFEKTGDREGKIGLVNMLNESCADDRSYYAKGINKRLDNISHLREIIFYRDGSGFEIIDSINSDCINTYSLLWHTPFEPKITIQRDTYIEVIFDRFIFKIYSEDTINCYLHYGDDDTKFSSFFFPRMGEYIPCYCIEIRHENKINAKIKTELLDVSLVKLI